MSVFCYGFRSVSGCTFLLCSHTVSVRRKKYLKLRVISENRFRNAAMRPRTLQQIWMYSQGPQIDPDVVRWCLQLTFTASQIRLCPAIGCLQPFSCVVPMNLHDASSCCTAAPESDWTSWPCSGKNGTVPGKFTSCGAQCLLLQTGRGVIIEVLGKGKSRSGVKLNVPPLLSQEPSVGCVCVWTRVTDLFVAAPLWCKQRLLCKANWTIMYLYFIFIQKCCRFGSDDVTSSAHQMPFSKLNGYYYRYYSDNLLTWIVLMETIHSIKLPDGKFTELINS